MWVRNLVCRIKRKFRPSVFQNRPLNRTFGPKKDELGGGWRKLTVEELLNLVYLPSIVTNGSCRIWHTDKLTYWHADILTYWYTDMLTYWHADVLTCWHTDILTYSLKELQIICGNKMPTRCNRGFYCKSYCLLNMFRAPLCPSSGAQEYYTVVAASGISCPVCSNLQTGHITLSSTPDQQLENNSTKYHRQQPLYNTLELLMMGIVVPETCWASNKICNKNLCSI